MINDEFRESAREFIEKWDLMYPLDLKWRLFYGVSFNSPKHRAVSLIDMILWDEETKFIESLREETSGGLSVIHKQEGIRMTAKEIDQAFDDLDIENLEINIPE